MKYSPFGLGSLWLALFLLSACIELPTQTPDTATETAIDSKPLTTQNRIYEPSFIKTVRMYAAAASYDNQQYFQPPIVALGQNQAIVLEFDQLGDSPKYYQAKIIHCNMDWTPSKLLEMEYINDINEFQVSRYQLSFRTKISYLHYNFTVPKVKLAGNYVLVLYKNSNKNDRILTRRFMIYENAVSITPEIRTPLQTDARDTKQQIDFKMYYGEYKVLNPREDFKMIIRQNFRWNKAVYDLKPTMVRDFDHAAEYHPLNGENYFEGLNEYRRFDCKSTRFLGYRIAGLNLKDSLRLEVEIDQTRANLPYFRMPDYNGNFVVGRQDAEIPITESDYIYMQFQLKSPLLAEDVYVLGAFNDWQASPENLMKYDAKQKLYKATIQLKQGEYTYSYAIKKDNVLQEAPFEGSFQNTENEYDVLIYHRPLGARTDKLIGYRKFNSVQSN